MLAADCSGLAGAAETCLTGLWRQYKLTKQQRYTNSKNHRQGVPKRWTMMAVWARCCPR